LLYFLFLGLAREGVIIVLLEVFFKIGLFILPLADLHPFLRPLTGLCPIILVIIEK